MSSWQDAFAQQTRACRTLGSVLTARVCDALARINGISEASIMGERAYSMRIWLDLMLKNGIGQVVDWSKVDKEDYLLAMESSPIKDV